jgi:hypothetical protein
VNIVSALTARLTQTRLAALGVNLLALLIHHINES